MRDWFCIFTIINFSARKKNKVNRAGARIVPVINNVLSTGSGANLLTGNIKLSGICFNKSCGWWKCEIIKLIQIIDIIENIRLNMIEIILFFS
ncbi:MAG: hypothetical protein ABRQ39_15870 [Candidatus Eremiobacterota bacterium]